MQLQDYGPTPTPEPPVDRDERKDESDLGDLLDVVDVAEAFDAFPCHLDLGCFDVSDCGGLDCVPCDLSF